MCGNGGFTFPGTRPRRARAMRSRSGPSRQPDQARTVRDGTGRVASANVTTSRCISDTATPSGLDPTFGDGRPRLDAGRRRPGRGGGDPARRGIVTAGWRTVGTGHRFRAYPQQPRRHTRIGFGKNGIATTDLGGADDQASDAALLPDSGIVAVGAHRCLGDPEDGVRGVRYRPDGRLTRTSGPAES